jgi:hypothetical protein
MCGIMRCMRSCMAGRTREAKGRCFLKINRTFNPPNTKIGSKYRRHGFILFLFRMEAPSIACVGPHMPSAGHVAHALLPSLKSTFKGTAGLRQRPRAYVFYKSMVQSQIWAVHTAVNSEIRNSDARSYKLVLSRQVFFSDAILSIIAAKMIPVDPKNGLERRVSRFCTICDKNQPLNGKKWESYGNFSVQMGLNF